MSVSNKLKGLLISHNENMASFSKLMGVTPQATSKKARNQTWGINDLLNIADLTGTTLAFIDDKGKPIVTFDMSDIKKD